jgi:energy-coupling factor transporter ATP-binding protein EcfA2
MIQIKNLQKIIGQRAFEVLEQIGMADQAKANLNRLPTSLLRRLAYGRAILHHLDVLLLYEPFARCDEATIALLSGLMRIFAEQGATILILAGGSAHLSSLCDKIHKLQQGSLVEADLSVAEQRDQAWGPNERYIRLAVAIFHPPGGASYPDPIIYLSGGRGASMLETMRYQFEWLAGPAFAAGQDADRHHDQRHHPSGRHLHRRKEKPLDRETEFFPRGYTRKTRSLLRFSLALFFQGRDRVFSYIAREMSLSRFDRGFPQFNPQNWG